MSEKAPDLAGVIEALGAAKTGIRNTILSRQRRHMLVLLTAAMVQGSGIVAIWTTWQIGLTMALLAGMVMCVGLAAEHATVVKTLEGQKP